jgi:uncharacterized membrane protein YgdD (TMEM256/DUF423 family)
MSYRIWLFLAGLSGASAVAAAAYGAHGLNGAVTFSASVKIYETAALFHALHALALTLTAVLLAATEGRRGAFACWMLNIAALAFVAGTVLFSGGVYYQIVGGAQSTMPALVVPTGGIAFMVGWVALALSAFGFREAQAQTSGV